MVWLEKVIVGSNKMRQVIEHEQQPQRVLFSKMDPIIFSKNEMVSLEEGYTSNE